jgi:hypothetical protein
MPRRRNNSNKKNKKPSKRTTRKMNGGGIFGDLTNFLSFSGNSQQKIEGYKKKIKEYENKINELKEKIKEEEGKEKAKQNNTPPQTLSVIEKIEEKPVTEDKKEEPKDT